MKANFGTKVSGHHEGDAPIFVFTHGWPDDESLWDDLVDQLKEFGCCVRITLPNFGDQTPSKNGFDFRELIEGFHDAVLSVAGERKVILIGHDWGAHLSYLFEKLWPDSVQAMVTIDVGPRIGPDSIGHGLFIASYQWWLIDAWSIGKIAPSVGTAMSQALAKGLGAPHPERTRFEMNYPYIYYWRDLFRTSKRPESLAHYSPTVPVLFLYGGLKPYMFHTQNFCEHLEANSPSKVVEFSEAGHWLMLQEPDRTASEIIDWFEEIGILRGKLAEGVRFELTEPIKVR